MTKESIQIRIPRRFTASAECVFHVWPYIKNAGRPWLAALTGKMQTVEPRIAPAGVER